MYLLDTHVLLWCLEGSSRLKSQAKQLITNPDNIIFVSTVSVWEITVKKMLGKLEAPDNLIEIIEETGFKPLSINFQDAAAIEQLPPIHNDPFDRLLIAQTMVHKLTLITHDAHCLAYTIPTYNPT